MECRYEPCREIKLFLKQVKLIKNITFNCIRSMKIFRVPMLNLK